MEDLTDEVARRLGTDPRVLAVLVGAPWHHLPGADPTARTAGAAGTGSAGAAGTGSTAGTGSAENAGSSASPPVHGRVFVGVPSPSELRALDLPADGLRHFGLTPAQLRAGGWTDADLRAAGLPVPGAGPDDTAVWFVAGQPIQLMLRIAEADPPRLARAESRRDGDGPQPADAEDVPGLAWLGVVG